MKRKYDLIFSLGQACGCSKTLRKASLQYLSFAGDWCAAIYAEPGQAIPDHDLRTRVDMLLTAGPEFFRREDMVCFECVEGAKKDSWANKRTQYRFRHDFLHGVPIEEMLPKVAARYKKRRERLFELIRGSKRVLAARMDVPGAKLPTAIEDCRYARERLNAFFAPVKFDFLLVSDDPSIPFAERRFEEMEEGLFRLTFGFEDPKVPLQPNYSFTVPALAEHFAVADYRTFADRWSYFKTSFRKRWQQWGNKLKRHIGR